MKSLGSETPVKVKILDHEYSIVSDDAEKVLHIAAYLNEQIERITAESPVLNRIDLSVMAAFQAATDLFQAREDLGCLREKVEEEAEALAARIDENLTQPLVGRRTI